MSKIDKWRNRSFFKTKETAKKLRAQNEERWGRGRVLLIFLKDRSFLCYSKPLSLLLLLIPFNKSHVYILNWFLKDFWTVIFPQYIIRYFQCFYFTLLMSGPYYLLIIFTTIIRYVFINLTPEFFIRMCLSFCYPEPALEERNQKPMYKSLNTCQAPGSFRV